MEAYNKTDLYNKYVQEQSLKAREDEYISHESFEKILLSYPCKLYTPNYFIRIALALLTSVAVFCIGLLLWLLSGTSDTSGFITLFILLAIACYFALELFVKTKHYYNAGVDNALIILVIIFTISSFFTADFESSSLMLSGFILLLSAWLSLRFTDAFMAMISFCALIVFVFLLYIKAGNIAKATVPFLMMAVSMVIYFISKKLLTRDEIIYKFCLQTLMVLSLITFYASGNYFIVKELGKNMMGLTANDPIIFGWFFWIFTILIPPAYLLYGIIKKDFLFIRCGLGLVAATIFTIKFYYTIMPAELIMLTAGILLIAISYALIRYLKVPHHGFTSANMNSSTEIMNAEALIIAQTFDEKQSASDINPLFGGGSGGGGGATGNY